MNRFMRIAFALAGLGSLGLQVGCDSKSTKASGTSSVTPVGMAKLRVCQVDPGSLAAQSGLQIGDEVISYANHPLNSPADFLRMRWKETPAWPSQPLVIRRGENLYTIWLRAGHFLGLGLTMNSPTNSTANPANQLVSTPRVNGPVVNPDAAVQPEIPGGFQQQSFPDIGPNTRGLQRPPATSVPPNMAGWSEIPPPPPPFKSW